MIESLRRFLIPFLFLIPLCISPQPGDLQDSIESLLASDADYIGQYDYSNFTHQEYIIALSKAREYVSHSNELNRKKGTILLAALARQLALDIDSGKKDPKDSRVRSLLDMFAEVDYYIHQPVVSKFIKFVSYLCEGNYAHIGKRFRESGFFYPVSTVFALYVIVFLLNLFSVVKWRYRRIFIRITLIGILLILSLFLFFKLTCGEQIGQYSFYGIPM